MKKPIYLLVILSLVLFSCSREELDNDSISSEIRSLDAIAETDSLTKGKNPSVCFTTPLYADQDHFVGYVSFTLHKGNFVVTYLTKAGWTIDETHLMFTDCSGHGFPQTANGNIAIDEFTHISVHDNGTQEVTYYVKNNDFGSTYCFSAHAYVSGPEGDYLSAWSTGSEFEGDQEEGEESFATYVEASKYSCETTKPDSSEQ